MSRIDGLGSQSPIQRIISQPVRREVSAGAGSQVPLTDKLELSGLSHMLRALKSNDVRTEKVAQVRGAIEAGTYEDDHKLDIATDRLLDDLLK